jgi:hypothetical protein
MIACTYSESCGAGHSWKKLREHGEKVEDEDVGEKKRSSKVRMFEPSDRELSDQVLPGLRLEL